MEKRAHSSFIGDTAMKLDSKVLVCLLGLSLMPISQAAEKKIAKSELPAAVQKTADEQSKGATVKGYNKETENGQLEYEVAMTVNGHSKDVSIAPDGRVLEVEEQVELSNLAATVQAGLKSKAGKGTITKVESLTKQGSVVAYEAQVNTNGKRSEIQVGPTGKPLNHEE
jgi:uncharacterized membrane protein YkoI